MRLERTLVATAIVGIGMARATAARAAEVHFTSDGAHVTVDEAGVAHVEHTLVYRIAGALPKSLDLAGLEATAMIEPTAASTLDGEPIADAHVERKGDRALRVTFDAAPAHRGTLRSSVLDVHVGYTVDLVKEGELTAAGALWRLRWTAPAAPDGYDSARVVFDLPAAPTEPRVVVEEGSAEDDGRTTTLKRGPQRDELAIERAHVAKGEAATWTAHVDPRAFPRVVDPGLRGAPAAALQPVAPSRTRERIAAVIVGLLFGALVRSKHAAFATACAARGIADEGVVPWLPRAWSAWLAGTALGLGVLLQAASWPFAGAACVVLATALAVSRAPVSAPAPRGPGQWLALTSEDAFATDPEAGVLGCTDTFTNAGKWALLGVVVAAIALGLVLGAADPAWTWLVPLDALALLPIFLTGSRAQLPPDRARSSKATLAAIHRLLKRDGAVRVSPWARVPTGATAPDELRLLVLPRAPIPGVVGIEVGVAWTATPAGYAPETEVLVRVRDATEAAARLVAFARGARPVHGRKTDERVVRMVPSLPSRRGALALVQRVAGELRDRRKSLPSVAWKGAERRLPPNQRLAAPHALA
jgi:hypothetical protein